MKKTAAQLAVYALEQLGIRHTYGIPGVHNTELYDELLASKQITPHLVTHEGGGAFMADGYSRTRQSESDIGTLVIVPAAGFTHAASGIGEAFLDGIPMLILTGGVRTDTPWQHKLHQVDQLELARGITKAAFRVERHADVVSTIFEAHRIALSGQPGPVLVEIPVHLQLFPGEVHEPLPQWPGMPQTPALSPAAIAEAAQALRQAKKVGFFVGWGAREAHNELVALAELLQAPVSTSLQGLASFPADHPLHVGFGFGPSAVPAAQNAFRDCDAVLAVGVRFGEIPTGSYGVTVPPCLVHIDIDPVAIGLNYPARVGIVADAQKALAALLQALQEQRAARPVHSALQHQIAEDKAAYQQDFAAHDSGERVNPARFFAALRAVMPQNAITVLDDGNHTFLTAELLPIPRGGRLICPTDFNAMGYAVPAAIGSKLANPDREVWAVVGDGAFAMSGMELLTARAEGLGLVVCVFSDGELSQIAQAQAMPYQRKACTALPGINLAGAAQATGARYVALHGHHALSDALQQARQWALDGEPVIVDVAVDYSRATAFTTGTTKTTFKNFSLSNKLRVIRRMLWRKVFGAEA